MLFYLSAFLVFVLDQLTKIWIRAHVPLGQVEILWGMRITHYENSGMAHSLLSGYGRYFALAAAVFIVLAIYARRRLAARGILLDLGLGCMVGGAAGNGIDRVLFGHVTDFLLNRSGTGILDVSDYALNVGILLVILHTLWEYCRRRMSSSSE